MPFILRSTKKTPMQLFLELYKAGRKENGSGKQSKSCDTAFVVKGLGTIHEERKKCPPLVYFYFMAFKGSG